MSRRALIVVDMQHEFLDRWESARVDPLIARTNALVAACRRAGWPVIWVREEHVPDMSDASLAVRDQGLVLAAKGTKAARLHADLDVRDGDPIVVKTRYSAFFGTDLDVLVQRLGLTAVTIAGVNTHACVRMTAIDAYQRDLRVTLATDCMDSNDDEHARVSLAYMSGKIGRTATGAQIAREIERTTEHE